MTRKSRALPVDAVPGKDVFGNVVNVGDNIAMATKSYGSAHINKGRYLGQRKPSTGYSKDFRCYIVEQDLVRTLRVSAAGVKWQYVSWRSGHQDQKAELEAAIGLPPTRPTSNEWDPANRAPERRAIIKQEWDAYYKAHEAYNKKEEKWLNKHYPFKDFPYVRRSTLWLNKIIKL